MAGRGATGFSFREDADCVQPQGLGEACVHPHTICHQPQHDTCVHFTCWSRRSAGKEPADVSVAAEINDLWPGHRLELKQGESIAQFTELQQREVEWMKGQGLRMEFRRVETVDEIRSDLGGGTTYTVRHERVL